MRCTYKLRSNLKILIAIPILFTLFIKLRLDNQSTQIDTDQQSRSSDPPFLAYQPPANDENATQFATNLKEIIKRENKAQYIRNEHFLNSNERAVNLTVLFVQVNRRITYLKELIDSLKNVQGISNTTLIIFSHDYYDDELNKLVADIDFAPTMQIFYPYMLQVYFNKYPGPQWDDCNPDNMTKELAVLAGCANAKSYDSYGHYRSYKVVQIKLHWFWKLNFLFEQIRYLSDKNFDVLLLEEDYFLMPDSLYLIHKLKEKVRSPLDIISLGFFKKQKQETDYKGNGRFFSRAVWHSGFHNTGMVINTAIWNALKGCAAIFCSYDDYNWDWTMQFVGQKCYPPGFNVIYLPASRVLHIGACGTHFKGKACDVSQKSRELNEIIEAQNDFFFPSNPVQQTESKVVIKLTKPNGGWPDPRDHQLCKSFLDNQNDTQVISAS